MRREDRGMYGLHNSGMHCRQALRRVEHICLCIFQSFKTEGHFGYIWTCARSVNTTSMTRAHAVKMITRQPSAIGFCSASLLLVLLLTLLAQAKASEWDFLDSTHLNIERQSDTPPTCPGSNGTTYVSNGQNFTIECGFDRYSTPPNLAAPSPEPTTFAGCVDYCANLDGCVDVTYEGGYCYAKAFVGWAVYDDNAQGARLTSDTYNQTIVCPASDGKNFTSAEGNVYMVQCNTDRAGGYITDTTTVGLDDCINLCDKTTDCVTVSWAYNGAPTAKCYTKAMGEASTSMLCFHTCRVHTNAQSRHRDLGSYPCQ